MGSWKDGWENEKVRERSGKVENVHVEYFLKNISQPLFYKLNRSELFKCPSRTNVCRTNLKTVLLYYIDVEDSYEI